jgi:hypothetical protein
MISGLGMCVKSYVINYYCISLPYLCNYVAKSPNLLPYDNNVIFPAILYIIYYYYAQRPVVAIEGDMSTQLLELYSTRLNHMKTESLYGLDRMFLV